MSVEPKRADTKEGVSAAAPNMDEEVGLMCTKEFTIPMGFSIITFHRGQLIAHRTTIAQLKNAYTTNPPFRPITRRDLIDRGLL